VVNGGRGRCEKSPRAKSAREMKRDGERRAGGFGGRRGIYERWEIAGDDPIGPLSLPLSLSLSLSLSYSFPSSFLPSFLFFFQDHHALGVHYPFFLRDAGHARAAQESRATRRAVVIAKSPGENELARSSERVFVGVKG